MGEETPIESCSQVGRLTVEELLLRQANPLAQLTNQLHSREICTKTMLSPQIPLGEEALFGNVIHKGRWLSKQSKRNAPEEHAHLTGGKKREWASGLTPVFVRYESTQMGERFICYSISWQVNLGKAWTIWWCVDRWNRMLPFSMDKYICHMVEQRAAIVSKENLLKWDILPEMEEHIFLNG